MNIEVSVKEYEESIDGLHMEEDEVLGVEFDKSQCDNKGDLRLQRCRFNYEGSLRLQCCQYSPHILVNDLNNRGALHL